MVVVVVVAVVVVEVVVFAGFVLLHDMIQSSCLSTKATPLQTPCLTVVLDFRGRNQSKSNSSKSSIP